MSGSSSSSSSKLPVVASNASNALTGDLQHHGAPVGAQDYDDALDSQGLFLEGRQKGDLDDIECLEDYQEGGFHPVHLGDCYGESGRYRVLHKLGHGESGTVWLCRDTLEARYVALKIMGDDDSLDEVPELTIAQCDQSLPGAEYILKLLDAFSLQGPNGMHHCTVLPVLGPCVSPRLWFRFQKDPGTVLRKMAQQTAQALDFLHKHQLCHGGVFYFRPSNILVQLTSLDHLPEETLLSMLGQPEKVQVRTESGGDLPAFAPKYLVPSADMCRLGSEYLTDEICVIDFGEAYPFSLLPEELGIPETYLPPEVLLKEKDPIGPACDLWALGCTLFEIRQQAPLFDYMRNVDELLADTVRLFGKFPDEWWNKWEAKQDFFDSKGKWIRQGPFEQELSLEAALSEPTEIVRPSEKNPKKRARMSFETPEEEQKLLADLLRKLCQNEPGKRITAEEVLQHEWFKF